MIRDELNLLRQDIVQAEVTGRLRMPVTTADEWWGWGRSLLHLSQLQMQHSGFNLQKS